MSKLLGFSSVKSLDRFKSLSASSSGAAKTMSISSRLSSDSVACGSFASLKLTAEKLVKEQASAKTDLELATSKMKKLTEHIRILEEKLQNAYNDNAKLKVKQKEDEKLWRGLESKFSSTKTLCDQLTETLQHLAGQVQDAEKDKGLFEDRLLASSAALDNLHEQMKVLSLRLESSKETVANRDKELEQLGVEHDKREKYFIEEQSRLLNLIDEKDATIKRFEATVEANGLTIETLKQKLENLQLESRLKEDDLQSLKKCKEELDTENRSLLSRNQDLSNKLDVALAEIKKLEGLFSQLAGKFAELDIQNHEFSEKIKQLTSLYDFYFNLVEEEKGLLAHRHEIKIDRLQQLYQGATSEKQSLESVNNELSTKLSELQKDQELAMVQHAEDFRLEEEKIQRLELEAKLLQSEKIELQSDITKLQENINSLSENSRRTNKKMEELSSELLRLEIVNKDQAEKLKADLRDKEDEIDLLQKDSEKRDECLHSLEKQLCELRHTLEQKEQLLVELTDSTRQLEEQKTEIKSSLADVENELVEAKKQYDQMLENKQLELSRHLKEISLKNDQAVNDILKKYEVEKLESINAEKEKAENAIREMELKFEQKLAICKDESQQFLLRVQEEHAALITRIQQEQNEKENCLIAKHGEELKHMQLQADKDLREKTMSLRDEHEAQLKALKCEHKDELQKLQEELDIQKSKEERQRALLQLQWKVMGDNPQEEQEVNSRRKDYSISSAKRRNPFGDRRSQDVPHRAEVQVKDSAYLRNTQTPVSQLLKKVEDVNAGSRMSLPKHSKKVTHHEYEVETSNGRTITKRRKTKSTVMFADPAKHKNRHTPKANTPRGVSRGSKEGVAPKPSTIGDLFSEGSLNPYADDPYAFD